MRLPSLPSPRPPGIPEVLSVLALGGIAVVLWPEPAPHLPPEGRRCGAPEAPLDCFLRVPGSTFLMGAQASDPEAPGYHPAAAPNEGPVREVTVAAFWIMRTEATVDTYRACVTDGACSEDQVSAGGGFSTYAPIDQGPAGLRGTWPVNSITWDGASALCAWLGGRLPTEAEWELAARGTDGRAWPWPQPGICPVSDLSGYQRVRPTHESACSQDGPARADEVLMTSPFGLIGTAGNLWEWTADAYAETSPAQVASIDPTRSDAASGRTQRGGSWLARHPDEVRVTVRGGVAPDARLNDVGVRCAVPEAGP